MSKIAVLFPGIGYTCDKPLLYYSAKLAAEKGFEVVRVPYGNFPSNVKDILIDVDWGSYDEIVFFSKSVGTVVALSYASEHGIDARQVLYTPLKETFKFPVAAAGAGEGSADASDAGKSRAIAFHGTGDPWAVTEDIVRICEEKEIPLYLTKDANHSLECGKAIKDIKTIRKVMRTVKEFL